MNNSVANENQMAFSATYYKMKRQTTQTFVGSDNSGIFSIVVPSECLEQANNLDQD